MNKTETKLTRTPKGSSTEKSVLVRMSLEQFEDIKLNAEKAGYKKKVNSGVSSYMRDLALGYKPKAHIDLEALNQLSKLRSNLVRLGNLFRLALVKDDDKKKWYAELKKLNAVILDIGKIKSDLLVRRI